MTQTLNTHEAIGRLGWDLVLAEDAKTLDLGDGLFRRVPARYAAERVASLAGRNPQTHRLDAASIETLVEQIETFEAKRLALGGHGPEVEQM